jgi:hypothetical protein
MKRKTCKMYISIQANSVSLDSAIRAVQQQQSVLNTVLRIRITRITLSNVEYNRAILLDREKKRRTSSISNLYNA